MTKLTKTGLYVLWLIVVGMAVWLFVATRYSWGQDAQSVVEPISDQTVIEAAISRAYLAARHKNPDPKYDYTIYSPQVELPPGTYTITDTIRVPNGVCWTYAGTRGVSLRWAGESGTQTTPKPIIYCDGGYGGELKGIEIIARNGKYLIGIEADNLVNGVIRECRVDLSGGLDCIGTRVDGKESVLIDRLNLTASLPLDITGGDNAHLRDLDLVAATSLATKAVWNDQLPSTPLRLPMPYGITIDGQNAFHGGDSLMIVETKYGNSVGNGLLISGNIRYEQPLATGMPFIQFSIANRPFEAFVVSGFIRASATFDANGAIITRDKWQATGKPPKQVDFEPNHFYSLGNR